ncbi:MAG: hypothetical protein Kow00121_60060 [Elainellaceae cyanobacterium]
MNKKWRLFWLLTLILLWLFCSGTARAETLADRLAKFPDWQGKPFVQPAKGDLVYPEWFAGDWTVTTTLVDMVAPLAPDVVTPGFESNRQFLDQPITFLVRFVEAEPQGIEWVIQPFLGHRSRPIVADRAFNGESLSKAYLGDRAILAVKVDPNNPNRQVTLLRDDRKLVSTVTARATETPDPDHFITTEIFQQEFLGAPQIYFNEVENTTAYSYSPAPPPPTALSIASSTDLLTASSDQPEITADQVTAIYLSPQDPDYFKSIPSENLLADPRPVALYHYRMEFYRAPDLKKMEMMQSAEEWLENFIQ